MAGDGGGVVGPAGRGVATVLKPMIACTSGATARGSAGADVFAIAIRPPRSRRRVSVVRNAVDTLPALPRTGIDRPFAAGAPGLSPRVRSDARTAAIAAGVAPKRRANCETVRKR